MTRLETIGLLILPLLVSESWAQEPVIPPGAAATIEVGFADVAGSGGGVVSPAPVFGGNLRVATRAGLQLGAGGRYGNHGIREVDERYTLVEVYVEPRYVAPWSSTTSPFVGGYLGRLWESVIESGANFRATGMSAGGSVGVLLKLERQLALEAGLRFAALSFGDFDFDGEVRWERCVGEHRSTNTVLPPVVFECSPRDTRRVEPQIPAGPGAERVRVLHPGTARTSTGVGLWLAFVMSFSGR